MNPEVKQLWLEALRDGEFTQGHCALHFRNEGEGNTYCCLGVLCSLAATAGICAPEFRPDMGLVAYDGESYSLPLSVHEWAELNGDTVACDADGSPIDLIHANDTQKRSFRDIAHLIERSF